MQEVEVFERGRVEVLFCNGVADFRDDAAGDLLDVHLLEVLAGYLADVDDDVWPDGRFACDVRIWVVLQACVEDCIGYLVRHLVWMSFRNGLRRKDVAMVLLCVHFHSL